MDDTSPAVGLLYTRLMLQRSGAERMQMAADMFETARVLMRASLAPRLELQDDIAMRMALLQRTYGNELPAKTYHAIEARLRGGQSTPEG